MILGISSRTGDPATMVKKAGGSQAVQPSASDELVKENPLRTADIVDIDIPPKAQSSEHHAQLASGTSSAVASTVGGSLGLATVKGLASNLWVKAKGAYTKLDDYLGKHVAQRWLRRQAESQAQSRFDKEIAERADKRFEKLWADKGQSSVQKELDARVKTRVDQEVGKVLDKEVEARYSGALKSAVESTLTSREQELAAEVEAEVKKHKSEMRQALIEKLEAAISLTANPVAHLELAESATNPIVKRTQLEVGLKLLGDNQEAHPADSKLAKKALENATQSDASDELLHQTLLLLRDTTPTSPTSLDPSMYLEISQDQDLSQESRVTLLSNGLEIFKDLGKLDSDKASYCELAHTTAQSLPNNEAKAEYLDGVFSYLSGAMPETTKKRRYRVNSRNVPRHVTPHQQAAFKRLERSVENLLKERDILWPGVVRTAMNGSYEDLGYESFAAFLEHASSQGVVNIRPLDDTGSYIVESLGSKFRSKTA